MRKFAGLMVMTFLLFVMASGVNATPVASEFFYNQLNLVSDNSAEYLLNSIGGGNYATDNGDTIVAVGDRLRGWFNVATIEDLTGGGGTHNVGTGGVNELSGVFDILVTAKVANGIGGWNFTFGPSGVLSVPNAMLELYEDSSPDYQRIFGGAVLGPDDVPGNVKEEALLATALGTSFMTFGFTGAGGEGWIASSITDDIAVIAVIPAPGNGGTANFALNLLANPSGVPLGPIPSIFGVGLVDINGSGNLLGIGGASTPADIFDDLNATLKPIPEPGTITLLGIGLLGAAIFARKKIRK